MQGVLTFGTPGYAHGRSGRRAAPERALRSRALDRSLGPALGVPPRTGQEDQPRNSHGNLERHREALAEACASTRLGRVAVHMLPRRRADQNVLAGQPERRTAQGP